MHTSQLRQLCCAVASCVFLCGCAFNVISVRQSPAHYQPVADSTSAWTLEQTTKVRLKEGFATDLKAGTTWRLVGHVDEGNVLHTADQVVTVEASHQYEADIVVKDNRLVGFYLRVEHTFTPSDPPVAIKLTPK